MRFEIQLRGNTQFTHSQQNQHKISTQTRSVTPSNDEDIPTAPENCKLGVDGITYQVIQVQTA